MSDLHGKRCILSEVNSFIFSLFGLLCESPLVDPDCFFSKKKCWSWILATDNKTSSLGINIFLHISCMTASFLECGCVAVIEC